MLQARLDEAKTLETTLAQRLTDMPDDGGHLQREKDTLQQKIRKSKLKLQEFHVRFVNLHLGWKY